MEQALKQKDYVEINFTGKIKDTDDVFDTTIKSVAEAANVVDENMRYEPAKICIGKGQILPLLDKKLEGMKPGESIDVDVPCEEAYGKKNPKLVQLVSTSKFKKQGINPVPGLRLNIDNMHGTIKSVSGGRTLVDFNHPLSGHDLKYHLTVERIISDDKEKLEALLKLINIPEPKIEITENAINIKANVELPDEILEKLKQEIKDTITDKEISISKE